MTPNKYTLEDIMAAWAEYKMPIHFADGNKVTEKELKGIFSSERIMQSDFVHYQTDRYGMGISFPEYLMQWIKDHDTK